MTKSVTYMYIIDLKTMNIYYHYMYIQYVQHSKCNQQQTRVQELYHKAQNKERNGPFVYVCMYATQCVLHSPANLSLLLVCTVKYKEQTSIQHMQRSVAHVARLTT